MGDDLLDHDIRTLIPEHIKIDNTDEPSNNPRGGHELVALINDSRHMSYRHHSDANCMIGSGASVDMTPSRESFPDYKPCTNGDYVSVAD